MGCGGGQMVSVLGSDDLSSYTVQSIFFCNIVAEKNENKQKEAGIGPYSKKWSFWFVPS